MPQSTMPQITNVVMLMLENRSLDNVFGYLYRGGEPLTFYPKGSPQRYDGIPAGASNPAFDWWGNLKSYPVLPIPVQQLLDQGDDPSIIPWWDPTEEYLSRFKTGRGVLNQMFGNQNMVSTLPPYGTRPPMLGFLQDYWTTETTEAYGGMDILWMFGPSQLPNLSTIARHGAISDAWFASVPTQTNPNRAYSIVGTSDGRDENLSLSAVEQFDLPTIFNALAQAGKACGLYFTDIWQQNQCFTQYTFPQLTGACDEIATIAQFYDRALNGTLLPFTYLEPKWGYGISGSIEMTQGTDLHPPTSVTPGDQFVGTVIQFLVRSPQWRNTLLIITFDEHGGTYDHVPPQWERSIPTARSARTASGSTCSACAFRRSSCRRTSRRTPCSVHRTAASIRSTTRRSSRRCSAGPEPTSVRRASSTGCRKPRPSTACSPRTTARPPRTTRQLPPPSPAVRSARRQKRTNRDRTTPYLKEWLAQASATSRRRRELQNNCWRRSKTTAATQRRSKLHS